MLAGSPTQHVEEILIEGWKDFAVTFYESKEDLKGSSGRTSRLAKKGSSDEWLTQGCWWVSSLEEPAPLCTSPLCTAKKGRCHELW
jgi:hypothetical protein